MVSGHDERIRAQYAQEAPERLAHLSQLALAVKSTGAHAPDPGTVAEMVREADTLKGGAAISGLSDVSRVAHALESVLERFRAPQATVSSDLVDGLLAGIDGLGALISAAARGDPHTRQADGLEAALRGLGVGAGGEHPPAGAGMAVQVAAGAGEHPGLTLAFRLPDPARVATIERPPEPAESEAAGIPVDRLDRLDELARLTEEAAAASLRLGSRLRDALGINPLLLPEYRLLSELLGRLEEQGLRARMVPVASIVEPLHRAVSDQARDLGKLVTWEVEGVETELDRGVLELLVDGLLRVVRNAVVHGIEPPDERVAAGKASTGLVRLHVREASPEIVVTVSDDGRGARDAPDLASAADTGGDVDVVRSVVSRVRGRTEIRSVPGRGSEFRLFVPVPLAVLPCQIVTAGEQRFALPMSSVSGVLGPQDPDSAGGRPIVWFGDRSVPLADLAATLGIADRIRDDERAHAVIVLAEDDPPCAFAVGALADQRELVVKQLSPLLPRLDAIAGTALEPDGSVLFVLSAAGLTARARRADPTAPPVPQHVPTRGRILVVDDAVTVRELQRSLLEQAGYEVATARDGVEALAVLTDNPQDLVLSDVEMPRMDGFSLLRSIRGHQLLSGTPVVLLTSAADDMDRRRALEAGADAYVVKSDFDAAALRAMVERLLQGRS